MGEHPASHRGTQSAKDPVGTGAGGADEAEFRAGDFVAVLRHHAGAVPARRAFSLVSDAEEPRVDPTSIRVVGDIPVAHSMWMTNAKTDSRTRLHIDFVELAPDFAPDLFSTLSLERSRDIPYLPRFEPAS